jgi:hypothetical protein
MSAQRFYPSNRLSNIGVRCPDCLHDIHPHELIKVDARLIQCPECKLIFNQQSELRTDAREVPEHAQAIRQTRR